MCDIKKNVHFILKAPRSIQMLQNNINTKQFLIQDRISTYKAIPLFVICDRISIRNIHWEAGEAIVKSVDWYIFLPLMLMINKNLRA